MQNTTHAVFTKPSVTVAPPRRRFFNTAGPCDPVKHYMLPPADRLRNAQLHRYVRDELYWALHAPRQTGKTTFLLSWAKELNAAPSGEFAAAYVTVECVQGIAEPERAMPSICDTVRNGASDIGLPVPTRPAAGVAPTSMLDAIMRDWAQLVAPRKLIVLFDEVDVMVGETLVSFLRQLRGGYPSRAAGVFPVSIALVGMRDIKDYLTAAKDGTPVNPGSPFNIKEDSASISNFTKENVVELFAQRTAETGQQITADALEFVWDQTRGQPWLVNSLFKRATMRVLDEDSTETVTIEHVNTAREQMLLARETHLDSLAVRLGDVRVKHVLESIISGEPNQNLASSEGFRIAQDLGLVVNDGRNPPTVANPIYREILARELSAGTQIMLPARQEFRWQNADGSLNMDFLLKEFQDFWRINADIWEETSEFHETFPHLFLFAFLQRITNGEGHIEREYAAGSGRVDLHIEFENKHYLIEIKIIAPGRTLDYIRETGLKQLNRYRSHFAPDIPAYLIIFDRRRPEQRAPWDKRIFWEIEKTADNNEITIVGC